MSFQERLKEERKRLKLTQPDLADLAGTSKSSQLNYEKGKNIPGSDYLEAVAKVGVDVQYLLTGVRSNMALSPEEHELLQLYRNATLPGKAAAIAALSSGVNLGGSRMSVTVGGNNIGNIAGDNMTIHETRKTTRGNR